MPLMGREKTLIVISFLSILITVISISSSAAYSVENIALKPHCLSLRTLFSLKYEYNCVQISFSNTLAMLSFLSSIVV